MKILPVLFIAFAFSACATVKTSVTRPIPKNEPVAVIPDRSDMDDYHIHSLLISALQDRGFRAVDGRSFKENPPTTVLRYNDYWFWDLVPYLRALDVRVLDGKTNEVMATSSYREGIIHGYPVPRNVVRHVFNGLQEKGAVQ